MCWVPVKNVAEVTVIVDGLQGVYAWWAVAPCEAVLVAAAQCAVVATGRAVAVRSQARARGQIPHTCTPNISHTLTNLTTFPIVAASVWNSKSMCNARHMCQCGSGSPCNARHMCWCYVTKLPLHIYLHLLTKHYTLCFYQKHKIEFKINGNVMNVGRAWSHRGYILWVKGGSKGAWGVIYCGLKVVANVPEGLYTVC